MHDRNEEVTLVVLDPDEESRKVLKRILDDNINVIYHMSHEQLMPAEYLDDIEPLVPKTNRDKIKLTGNLPVRYMNSGKKNRRTW